MFGVEIVTARAAVYPPKMVVVNFNQEFRGTRGVFGEDLAINRCIFCPHYWVRTFGREFSWHVGAVSLTDHEYGFELYEEGLFEIITQPIMVRINGPALAILFRNRRMASSARSQQGQQYRT